MNNSIKIFVVIVVFLLICFIVLVSIDAYHRKSFWNLAYKQINVDQDSEFAIKVNRSAPVVCKEEIIVNASSERVWGILTDINNWNKWQSAVTESHLHSEVGVGIGFDWKAGGLSFQSLIHTSEYRKKLGWVGTTIGAQAVHNWILIEEDDGQRTKIVVEESLEGIIPSLLSDKFKKDLRAGMLENLRELKVAAEYKD